MYGLSMEYVWSNYGISSLLLIDPKAMLLILITQNNTYLLFYFFYTYAVLTIAFCLFNPKELNISYFTSTAPMF